MLKVAITGGIGSGKSFILNKISQLKMPVISADEEISKIYQNFEILAKIAKAFNLENITKDSIKPIVLKDKSKLKILEKILYKELYKNFQSFEDSCRRKNFKACFFEIPLLFEKKTECKYDKIINISVPLFIQKRRFLKRSGATEKDFYRFLALQLHGEKKKILTKKNKGIVLQNYGATNTFRIQKLLNNL
jgi:dephospho-CoA kinase